MLAAKRGKVEKCMQGECLKKSKNHGLIFHLQQIARRLKGCAVAVSE